MNAVPSPFVENVRVKIYSPVYEALIYELNFENPINAS